MQAARALGYVNRRYTGQYEWEVKALEVLRHNQSAHLCADIMTFQVLAVDGICLADLAHIFRL